MTVVVGGTYEHFKGNRYELLCVAQLESDLTPMAVYQSLKDGEIYTRPLQEFISPVDKVRYPEATQEYRFELVKK